ncbi:MAG: hypothetical protein LBH70_08080 [Spirochaetaceae bacterium]|jgi:hypothetical protein|nr:hypothetical protein [Spirochaetaceae bacterium]
MKRGIIARFCVKQRVKAFITLLLYSLLRVSSLQALEEKVFVIGASSGWNTVENRVQLSEIPALRPFPVLALSSAWTEDAGNAADEDRRDILALYEAYRNFPAAENAVDLSLSFDQPGPSAYRDARGRYRVEASPALQRVDGRWARYGAGAAMFAGTREEGVPLRLIPETGIFSPGRGMRDFSIEFWLYPNNLENGEQILAWTAVPPKKNESLQRIFCEAVRSRIRWTFLNFFAAPGSPDQSPALSISLETRKNLVPRTWSHHLVRYDASTGLLEYLVNGEAENAAYTTLSGREGGSVYTPYPGRDGFFVLGGRYSGLIDEFRIYREAIGAPGRGVLNAAGRTSPELPDLAKFPKSGGRFETRSIDLGEPGSTVLRIEASGGRYTAGSAGRRPVRNMYEGKGDFRFPDDSAVQFFLRAGEEPYRLNRVPWTPVRPGTELSGEIRGRYVQLAAAFYPSGNRETGPYLEEVKIVYESNEAPYPPSLVTARALDGAVELNWRPSPDSDTTGYLVYYGTSAGVYYGEDAVQGASPIDAGKRTSLRLEGLKNGVLYFFAIAAYDGNAGLHAGQFSKEVTARPLRTSE